MTQNRRTKYIRANYNKRKLLIVDEIGSEILNSDSDSEETHSIE